MGAGAKYVFFACGTSEYVRTVFFALHGVCIPRSEDTPFIALPLPFQPRSYQTLLKLVILFSDGP
jgi:hypothetical protein